MSMTRRTQWDSRLACLFGRPPYVRSSLGRRLPPARLNGFVVRQLWWDRRLACRLWWVRRLTCRLWWDRRLACRLWWDRHLACRLWWDRHLACLFCVCLTDPPLPTDTLQFRAIVSLGFRECIPLSVSVRFHPLRSGQSIRSARPVPLVLQVSAALLP